MKNIPKLEGFEHIEVLRLTDDQKDLAVQALGYALSEKNLIKVPDEMLYDVLETFTSYLDRGLIL